MGDLLNHIKIIGETTQEKTEKFKKVWENTIDLSAIEVHRTIEIDMPYEYGNLKSSFTRIAEKNSRRYGWYLQFEGTNMKGVAYQLIANTINKGFPPTRRRGAISGTRFMDFAVQKLKGLDKKLVNAIQIVMVDEMGRVLR